MGESAPLFPLATFAGLTLATVALVVFLLGWGNGATQKAHAAVDPAVNLSLSAPGCNSEPAGPSKCSFPSSVASQTVSFNVLSFMTGGYAGYDMDVTYSGSINYVAGSIEQMGAGVWPDCASPGAVISAGHIVAGCAIGGGAPNSTYLGTLLTLGFSCKGVGPGTISLNHGEAKTDLVDADLVAHSEAAAPAHEDLTVNCVLATATPTATPCPPGKVPAIGGCGTPTPTPTATPCPTGKVPVSSGCGTPTPTPTATATPCPTGKVPVFGGCGTPTPTPEVNLSLSVGSQCDSSNGPAHCAVEAGSSFTVNFNVLSFMAGGYAGYEMHVTYAGGVNRTGTALQQTGAGAWPDCAFPANVEAPGDIIAGCAVATGAPNSTYLGTLLTMDFSCKGFGSGTVTLKHGDSQSDLVDENQASHSEADAPASESLTISCHGAPVATPTPTPPPPIGGISLDSGWDPRLLETTSASGLDRAGLAGAIAAITTAGLTAAAALWHRRRRA